MNARIARAVAALRASAATQLALANMLEAGGEEAGEGDPWVPHTDWPWAPREATERARLGLIPGARKVGKKWLARRSAIDLAIEQGSPPLARPLPSSTPANDADPALDVLKEIGCKPIIKPKSW